MTILVSDSNGRSVPAVRPGATQNVAIGSSSVQSTALGASTTLVRALATVDCWLAFGSNPTATTSGYLLVAGMENFIPVTAGSKIAVIRASVDGTLNIVEGA